MDNSVIDVSNLDDVGRIELSKKVDKRALIQNFLNTFKLLQENINLTNEYNSLQTELNKNEYNKNNGNLDKKINSLKSIFSNISLLYFVWCIVDLILTHTTSGHTRAVMEIINRGFADLCYKSFIIIWGIPYLIFTKAFNHIGLHITGFSIFNLSTKVMSDKYLGEVCIGFFMIPVLFFIIKKIILTIYKNYLIKYLNHLDDLEYKKDLEKYNDTFQKNIQLRNHIRNQMESNYSEINSCSIIPKAYRFNHNAIHFFIYCLSNGRADTLKECINLYHTESYRNSILNYMDNINWNINNLYNQYSNLESSIGFIQSNIDYTQSQNEDILDRLK